MRGPSLIGLLGILQQYGLTYQHLAMLVSLTTKRYCGPVILQFSQGRILDVQVVPKAPAPCAQEAEDRWGA